VAAEAVIGLGTLHHVFPSKAARKVGEAGAVPLDLLGGLLVGSVVGIAVHHLSAHDPDCARRDLRATRRCSPTPDPTGAGATGQVDPDNGRVPEGMGIGVTGATGDGGVAACGDS
jgi:hypothetical protein